MSLSKHALTYLKRHYRALYQRAYALGLAPSLMRWVNLIPVATTAQKPASPRARRSRAHPALPLLIAITTLTCGPRLEAVHAATLNGTVISGNDNQAVYINQEGTYTVAIKNIIRISGNKHKLEPGVCFSKSPGCFHTVHLVQLHVQK